MFFRKWNCLENFSYGFLLLYIFPIQYLYSKFLYTNIQTCQYIKSSIIIYIPSSFPIFVSSMQFPTNIETSSYCIFCKKSNGQDLLTLIMMRVCCVSYECICHLCALGNPAFNPNFRCKRCNMRIGRDCQKIQLAAKKKMNLYIKKVED